MAFGTLSPIQRRCKEFTEHVLQEILAIRQRERYLNDIKACITGYPPEDEAEPFVPENFSQYQFFLPFEDIIDYTHRFDFLMCCLAAGVCKVHKGFEERFQRAMLQVLTFRSTTNPSTPLGYILSPELLPLVRYEETNEEEDAAEEEAERLLAIEAAEAEERSAGGEGQLQLMNGEGAAPATPVRPGTAGRAGALVVTDATDLTHTTPHPLTAPTSTPTRSSQKIRKILTEKEQVLNDVEFDTSGLTVQEIEAERARRKQLQTAIIDEYIANKDSYVSSVKEELMRLLAEEEAEKRARGDGTVVYKTDREYYAAMDARKEAELKAGALSPSPVVTTDVAPASATQTSTSSAAAPPQEQRPEGGNQKATPIRATASVPTAGVVGSKSPAEAKRMSALELVLACKADSATATATY